MLDQSYFDKVLPEQLQLMELPVRLTIHLSTGDSYVIHALIAAHPTYVVLKVYTTKQTHKHTKQWQAAHPREDVLVHDQACIPYAYIAAAHLTASTTKGDDVVIGFKAQS